MPSQTVVSMETSLVCETCWVCGITWAMPWGWARKRSEQGKGFYCPNGDKLRYGQSEIEKLKERLESEQRTSKWHRRRLESEQNSHRATKGHLTRQYKTSRHRGRRPAKSLAHSKSKELPYRGCLNPSA